MSATPGSGDIQLNSLIAMYNKLQAKVTQQLDSLCAMGSKIQPAAFLKIQFMMGQVTTIGESISNVIAQINSVVMAGVRNQKVQ